MAAAASTGQPEEEDVVRALEEARTRSLARFAFPSRSKADKSPMASSSSRARTARKTRRPNSSRGAARSFNRPEQLGAAARDEPTVVTDTPIWGIQFARSRVTVRGPRLWRAPYPDLTMPMAPYTLAAVGQLAPLASRVVLPVPLWPREVADGRRPAPSQRRTGGLGRQRTGGRRSRRRPEAARPGVVRDARRALQGGQRPDATAVRNLLHGGR